MYDSEKRRDATVLKFLGSGLARGERVIYLARSDDDPVTRELGTRGERGQVTVMPAEACYLVDGSFEPNGALTGFEEALVETSALGFPALRTAGGPPPSVTENGASHLLPGYERNAASLFADGRLVSLCSYDARRVSPGALLGIIDAHPVVIYALGEDERLEVRTDGTRLELSGWLDATTLGALIEPLGRALHGDEDVTVDLGDLAFVDIVALRLFAEAARELHDGSHTLTLIDLPEPAERVVEMLGLAEQEGLLLR